MQITLHHSGGFVKLKTNHGTFLGLTRDSNVKAVATGHTAFQVRCEGGKHVFTHESGKFLGVSGGLVCGLEKRQHERPLQDLTTDFTVVTVAEGAGAAAPAAAPAASAGSKPKYAPQAPKSPQVDAYATTGTPSEMRANLQAFEKELRCPICLEFVTEAVAPLCSHLFCRQCIAGWISKHKKKTCPVCNRHISTRSLTPQNWTGPAVTHYIIFRDRCRPPLPCSGAAASPAPPPAPLPSSSLKTAKKLAAPRTQAGALGEFLAEHLVA